MYMARLFDRYRTKISILIHDRDEAVSPVKISCASSYNMSLTLRIRDGLRRQIRAVLEQQVHCDNARYAGCDKRNTGARLCRYVYKSTHMLYYYLFALAIMRITLKFAMD